MKLLHLKLSMWAWLLIARFHCWFNVWYEQHCPLGTVIGPTVDHIERAAWMAKHFGRGWEAYWEKYPIFDEDDLPHVCGDCGTPLQHVQPGKWQCDNTFCSSKREWTVKGWRHL